MNVRNEGERARVLEVITIGAADSDEILSGIRKVKYSCARMWLAYPP